MTTSPLTFDIRREHNPHLGFGGNGPHYCIGANLARTELRIMFDTIADVTPDIELTGPSRECGTAGSTGLPRCPCASPRADAAATRTTRSDAALAAGQSSSDPLQHPSATAGIP
ncbi:MAG: cytochrome [Mycobacterium sp.]|jgi:hypothetical protein|nr:cytochrome [Mycobacterium sp.]